MSNDRWVRIVDPNHILRVDIDDVWHPKYGTYGWKSVFSMAGKAAGACAEYKFRCRLCDVPDGIKIVDPGPDYELLDPWVTELTEVDEFWHKPDRKWYRRTGPKTLLSSIIYRRPIAKPSSKTPQPGEWWFNEKGNRVFIHGYNQKQIPIYEHSNGTVAVGGSLKDWHHEPNCTGWNWQPPQLEAQPEPLTLEQRLEEAERKINELGRLFQQWEPRH